MYNLLVNSGSTGFNKFYEGMQKFFETGLGGPGAKGFGIAIAVIGLVAAGISFAVHKANPQSRMPSWGQCLVAALVGSMLISGVATPLKWLAAARDWIYSLLPQ